MWRQEQVATRPFSIINWVSYLFIPFSDSASRYPSCPLFPLPSHDSASTSHRHLSLFPIFIVSFLVVFLDLPLYNAALWQFQKQMCITTMQLFPYSIVNFAIPFREPASTQCLLRLFFFLPCFLCCALALTCVIASYPSLRIRQASEYPSFSNAGPFVISFLDRPSSPHVLLS